MPSVLLPFRVRLAVLVAALSVVSITVLFALTFFSLYRTLRSEDLEAMRSRLLGYWAIEQTGGLDLLRSEIELDSLVAGSRPFVARIATSRNETVALAYPEAWTSFNFDRLELFDLKPDRILVLGSPEHLFNIEIGGIALSEGYLLQIGFSDANRSRFLSLFRRTFTVIAVAVVAVGLGLGLIAARRALAPVAAIERAAREIIDTGNLEARIPEPGGGGELRDLSFLLNTMISRIERLVDSLRTAVDTVAHDLRTPVARLTSTVELALQVNADTTDDKRLRVQQEALEEAQIQSQHILTLVNTLLEITRAESGVLTLESVPVDVVSAANEVCDVYELVAEDKGVALAVRADAPVVVEGDAVRLKQVIANLVDNAIKYNRTGGTVGIVVRERGDEGIIEVVDTGVGLTDEERRRVWERMYRAPGQPSESGLGLGLSIVKALVEAQGGRVEVESAPEKGSTFRVAMKASRR